jgi:hypothetical protein
MRVALAIAAMVAVPITAAADDPASTPATPAPTQQLPATPPPESNAPGAAEPPPAPPADPAYGERPDHDTRDFPAPRGKDIVVISYPERSKRTIWLLGGMAIGGAVLSGVGLYFHLDARSAVSDVSANKFTGHPWSDELQGKYDRANSSGIAAGVFYGIGGGLLLASAVAYIATEPKAEKITIHPHTDDKPTALIAPTRGGAMVGGAWRF